MEISFVLKGIFTGVAIAAPVGPTTVLVIHRVTKQSWDNGFSSGLGAALADSLFASLAGIGAGFVAGYITPHYIIIRLVGGLFLIYWGLRIFKSKFAESHPLVRDKGFGGPFFSTFLLTLTNPMTLLAFAAILVGLKSSALHRHPDQLISWAVGVFLGSFLWWGLLCVMVYPHRHKFNLEVLVWINRIMGAIIVVAGGVVFIDLVRIFLH